MELEQVRGREWGLEQLAEQPPLLLFGTNLMPGWKKAFLWISAGQPGGLASWPSRATWVLNCRASKVAF